MLQVTNSTDKKVTFYPEDMLGIVDLRSLGYYKIKQGVLKQNLSQYYHIESSDAVCDQCNNILLSLYILCKF